MSNEQPQTNAHLLDLVEQALTLPPGERLKWLAANSKPEVLDHARRLLDLASSKTAQVWSSPSEVPASVALEGRQIGPFKIDCLLGEGGMGQVYLALRNDGQFEQTVAIKLVRMASTHSAIAAQFDIERQILANLQHPNIAALLDGGTTEDGLHYVVMEYVDGVALGDYLRDRAPGVRETLRLFVKICRAVESAHRALVIHRDIKPANILVTEDGEPKLLDFGIAKVLHAGQEATDAKQTILGALTPAYASPEQIRGKPLTTASDVYSLGVVLYEALVGKRPHDTADLSPAETERLLTEVVPQAPSARVTRNAGALRGDVDAIVLKALAVDTERRYGAAGALADDLECYLSNQPVSAQPDSGWYRLQKLIARNRAASFALSVTTLAVLAGLMVSMWQAGVARDQRRLAVEQLGRAEAVSEFLGDILLSPSQNWDSSLQTGSNATVSDILDVAEKKLAEDLLDQPATRVELLGRISEARLWMEQPTRAVRTARAALVIAENELTGNTLLQVEARYRLASALAEENLHQEAISEYETAMALARESGLTGEFLWLYMLNDRAVSHSAIGEFDDALALQSEATDRLRGMFGDEVLPTWGIGYNNLGMFQFMVGDFASAEASFGLAMRGYEAFPEQNLLVGVSVLNNAGRLLGLQGRMEEAAASHERALALVKTLVDKGVGDEDYGRTVTRLVTPYLALGRSGRAIALLDELAASIDAKRLADHEEVWTYYDARAQCALALGEHAQALSWVERAHEAADEDLHPLGRAQRSLTATLAHAGAGHSEQAEEAAARSLAAYTDWLGGDHAVVLRVRETLATAAVTPQ